MLLINSCVVIESEIEDSSNVSDSLRINTWVLKEELEDNGYFTYDGGPPDGYRYDKGHYVTGHWITDDGTEIYDVEEIFEYEALEPNSPRILAPLGFDSYNLNIRLESDDVINVTTTVRNNHEIRLTYSPSSPDEVIMKDWVDSQNITVVGPFTMSILPIGKTTNSGPLLVKDNTLTDREYYIDINTYKLDGSPQVSAQLRLTVIEDEGFPWREVDGYALYGRGEERSRFLEIELVKFSYSDTVLHDEFEKYDHLYN